MNPGLSSTQLLPLPRRAQTAHKGDFGHVLVIGGDLGMGGAALLAGLFAARSGAGKVTIATRMEHISAIVATEPCLMAKDISADADLLPLLKQATALVLGPGLGRSPWSQDLFKLAIAESQPMVIDADALFWLKESNLKLRDSCILTPHSGEAAHLLNRTRADIDQDRFTAVTDLQTRYGGIVILKGAGTLIHDGQQIYQCNEGNPGMASGGMGDALSGMIGALLAQGLTPSLAAQTGVLAHAMAADQAAQQQGEIGLLASDLIQPLRQVLNGR